MRSSSECSGEGGPQMCNSCFCVPERREEPQAFDVVEVQMGDTAHARRHPHWSCAPKPAEVRARIEDEQSSVAGSNLERMACCRQSEPSPRRAWEPTRDTPRPSPGTTRQASSTVDCRNRAIIPTNSVPDAKSGTAVTEMGGQFAVEAGHPELAVGGSFAPRGRRPQPCAPAAWAAPSAQVFLEAELRSPAFCRHRPGLGERSTPGSLPRPRCRRRGHRPYRR